jgi:hypothetical protein
MLPNPVIMRTRSNSTNTQNVPNFNTNQEAVKQIFESKESQNFYT